MPEQPKIQVRVDEETKEALHRRAEADEMTVSSLVRKWIKEKLLDSP